MKIRELELDRILELAEQAGYEPPSHILHDAINKIVLVKFARLLGAELEQKQSPRYE